MAATSKSFFSVGIQILFSINYFHIWEIHLKMRVFNFDNNQIEIGPHSFMRLKLGICAFHYPLHYILEMIQLFKVVDFVKNKETFFQSFISHY